MPDKRNGAVAMNTIRLECSDAIAALEHREERIAELGPIKDCPEPAVPLAMIESNRMNRYALKVLLRKAVAEIDYSERAETLRAARAQKVEDKLAESERALRASARKWAVFICTLAGIVYAIVERIFS